MSSYRHGMIKCFSEVNGRKLEPHSELGLFSLPKLHLLDLSLPNSYLLPSGTPLVLPELLACLPVSLNELRVERRLIQGGLPSVQVYDHSDEFGDHKLHRCSVLYLPESICACTVAIATFAGEEPTVDQIGCGDTRDINCGLKY